MKKCVISIEFKEDWDYEAIDKVVKSYATNASIDKFQRFVCFRGLPEKGKEFLRTCEAIEPIISFTIKSINE